MLGDESWATVGLVAGLPALVGTVAGYGLHHVVQVLLGRGDGRRVNRLPRRKARVADSPSPSAEPSARPAPRATSNRVPEMWKKYWEPQSSSVSHR